MGKAKVKAERKARLGEVDMRPNEGTCLEFSRGCTPRRWPYHDGSLVFMVFPPMTGPHAFPVEVYDHTTNRRLA